MNREQILALCSKAHDVGSVKHTDYADYVVALESRRKVGDEWQTVEHAYMAVDGRLAMANQDHRSQGKRLDFAEPKVLQDTSEQLTLLITVRSEIYGTRHGIATSCKKQGASAEREFPWEVAETSAIGRALAAMGYGLLPGSGLASAEDMLRQTEARPSATHKCSPGNGNGYHICVLHDAPLEPHGNAFAHRVKGGGWCYGKKNGATPPVAIPTNGNGSQNNHA